MSKVSDMNCATCNQNSEYCMGHCGHIDLPLPVFNPLLVHDLAKLLKMVCFGCGRLVAGGTSIDIFK